MTHILIFQGTATGAPAPNVLHLSTVVNQPTFDTVVLNYVATGSLTLTRVVNAQDFDDIELENIDVTELTLATFTNAQTFDTITLGNLPFVAENTETDTLIAAFTGTYATTDKLQIDRLITELKEGLWAKLDWYGNAYWAKNEHDALLNWKLPTQTLTKVGAAFWTAGVGLSGVNPTTASGRYKSGWNISTGPLATTTSFCMFCKITAIAVPQNGMQPMGNFRLSSPGPAAPEGSFLNLSIPGNTGSGGANVLPFNGNSGFAVGSGVGLWATSRSGGTNITVKDGVTLDTDSVSGVSSFASTEGICVVGTPPAFGAQQSFPGTELYWGWGAALTAAEIGALDTALATALLPPFAGPAGPYWIVDDVTGDYYEVEDTSGDYFVVDTP